VAINSAIAFLIAIAPRSVPLTSHFRNASTTRRTITRPTVNANRDAVFSPRLRLISRRASHAHESKKDLRFRLWPGEVAEPFHGGLGEFALVVQVIGVTPNSMRMVCSAIAGRLVAHLK
jgi:hypothetical protein